MTARLIVQDLGGSIQVQLHHPGHIVPEPAGAPIPFAPPLTAEEREDLRWYLEDYLRIPVAVYQDRGRAIEGRLADWGHRLFDALFGPGRPGRDAYIAAMAGREPPALVLLSNAPAFLGLPWELLHDPARPNPLAFDLAALERCVTANAAAEEPPAGGALRVLVVIARPYGARDVEFRIIARPLMERLEAVAGRVRVEVLRPPTFAAMRARLAQAAAAGEPFHILHFDGHGGFGDQPPAGFAPHQFRGPQGCLLFETDAGGEDRVTAEDMATALQDGHVPVAVFNACRSGTIDGGAGPEAAVATRMVLAGAASVVAMSHSVYAVAAAEFMAAFYQALFEGRSVSRAVADGRKQLRKANLRPSLKGRLPLQDWVVPVHYARRDVAFPHLARVAPAGPGSLAARLEALRARPATPDGVHEEGDLSATGGVFVGRDAAFQELERALRTKRVAVVHGGGGAGKTELAKAFARWWRDTGALDRPDWVFVHSFEPGVASFGLDGVVSAIGLRLFGPDFAGRTRNAEERRDLLLEVLRERRMLLVWDNVETVHSMPDPQGVTPPLDEEQRAVMRDFLAALSAGGRSAVLLTSRSREDWLGDHAHRLELGGLAADERAVYADHLLAAHPAAAAGRADPRFPDLMEALDGHPLSMRLILPHLATRGPADLLSALRGETALPGGPGGTGRHASLDACIDYSLQHLPAAVRERLPLLALFEGVADFTVLVLACEDEAMPARFRGADADAWIAALAAAARVGLVTPRPTGVALHPALPARLAALWRAQAGGGFDADIAAARRALLQAFAQLGKWLLREIQQGDAGAAFATIAAQRRTLGRFLGLALETGAFAEAHNLIQPLREYFESRGLTVEAAGWYSRCRIATEGPAAEPPPFDRPAGALWLFAVGAANLALAAHELDAAFGAHDGIRRILEASPSSEARRHLAVAYHQLGIVAAGRGMLDEAQDWYLKSLAIEESLGNRSGMTASYHQLGMVAEGRGMLDEAQDWYGKSLTISEAIGDQLSMASSYHQLGIVAQIKGALSEAHSWYSKALFIREELGNRPGIAECYHQLGMLAQECGALNDARDWYGKSLAILDELGDRPGSAASYHQLGTVAFLRRALNEARDWYRKSLAITEALGDRPKMASSYGQLGLLALVEGRMGEALDWSVRAAALFPDFPHPATGPAPRYLALLTAALGLPALKESWLRQTGAPLPDSVRAALPALTEEARRTMPDLFAHLTNPAPEEPPP